MEQILNEEQIQSQFDRIISIINSFKNEDRKEKLLKLFTDQEEKIIFAPASTSPKFHSAFPGGYLYHTLNVCKFSMKLFQLWEQMGAKMDYTKEELLFCALVHDIGKIGNETKDYYILNDSEWHIDNRREYYKTSTDLAWMRVPDRSLWWLQKYNINISEMEYISILTHDGLYDESNKEYLIQYNPEKKFRTNMPLILHQADVMAGRIELETYN